MKILSTRRFNNWWQLARKWLAKQFADLTYEVRNAMPKIDVKLDNLDTSVVALDATTAKQQTLMEGIAAQAKDATVAKQATLVSRAAAILEAIGNIHVDIPDNIATEDDVTAAKQAILDALSHIDIDTSDLAKEATLGAAPIGSSKTTVFQYLAAILDNIEGQGGEDIPEGLGDRINLLLQFFGLPEALPEYTALTPAEAIAIARDCQYNVMGTDWPIPTWLPTGVTEAQVESAAEGLGIPYHEPTQTA